MATIKETMQQALDALKTCGYDYDREESIYKTYDAYQIDLAIEALEAELAKPEQPQTENILYLLSAWERGAYAEEYSNEIEVLRQAIAQPKQEPVWCGCGDGIVADDNAKCGVCVMQLNNQIERLTAQFEQEPVAFSEKIEKYDDLTSAYLCGLYDGKKGKIITLQNTAPPKRECQHCGKITKP